MVDKYEDTIIIYLFITGYIGALALNNSAHSQSLKDFVHSCFCNNKTWKKKDYTQ